MADNETKLHQELDSLISRLDSGATIQTLNLKDEYPTVMEVMRQVLDVVMVKFLAAAVCRVLLVAPEHVDEVVLAAIVKQARAKHPTEEYVSSSVVRSKMLAAEFKTPFCVETLEVSGLTHTHLCTTDNESHTWNAMGPPDQDHLVAQTCAVHRWKP